MERDLDIILCKNIHSFQRLLNYTQNQHKHIYTHNAIYHHQLKATTPFSLQIFYLKRTLEKPTHFHNETH